MWSQLTRLINLLIGVLVVCGAAASIAACGVPMRPAPELTGTKALNAAEPITLARLKGKIVVLDFWSYSCVNCLKTIAPLQAIEHQFKDDVTFIGVHSPKYDSEKPDRSVLSAMKRFGIDCVVVNDAQSKAWNNYAIDVWPTFVVIDPQGHIAHQFTGDRCLPALSTALATLVKSERASGHLNGKSIALVEQSDKGELAPLSAPGKIATDVSANQIFVSSTGNNQIVALKIDKAGRAVPTFIGSGVPGLADGTYDTCRFKHPEGLALDGNKLYVADTDNHAIRVIDLEKRTVSTFAGDGQARNSPVDCKLPICHAKLDSPWDLVLLNKKIYIAMAGTHQIWCLDPDSYFITRVAGSGREELTDGKGAAANLAQPSGLATDGKLLYFVDSESNSVRTLDPGSGEVATISGKAMNICGDKDGCSAEALFRHPEGVAVAEGKLYVADTFNNKVRVISLKERQASTLAGSGEAGSEDGTFATLNEPSGLAILGKKLYVADRANDAVRVIDLAGTGTSTLDLGSADKKGKHG